MLSSLSLLEAETGTWTCIYLLGEGRPVARAVLGRGSFFFLAPWLTQRRRKRRLPPHFHSVEPLYF